MPHAEKNMSGSTPNISNNSSCSRCDEVIYYTARWREKWSWTSEEKKDQQLLGAKNNMWCHQNNKKNKQKKPHQNQLHITAYQDT